MGWSVCVLTWQSTTLTSLVAQYFPIDCCLSLAVVIVGSCWPGLRPVLSLDVCPCLSNTLSFFCSVLTVNDNLFWNLPGDVLAALASAQYRHICGWKRVRERGCNTLSCWIEVLFCEARCDAQHMSRYSSLHSARQLEQSTFLHEAPLCCLR